MTDKTLPGRPPQWAAELFSEVQALRSEVAALRGVAQLPELPRTEGRAEKIASIRALADWLEVNPWLPVTDLYAHRHVYELDGYREVLDLAQRLSVDPSVRLNDRTTVNARIGCLDYSVIAWHDNGRPARRPADDPTPVSPAPVPLHIGVVEQGGELVDETPVEVPCYVPNGFQAPEVIAEREAWCAARHPGRACTPVSEAR